MFWLTTLKNRWVQTDMGNTGAVANGLEAAPVTIQDSINGLLGKVRFARSEIVLRFCELLLIVV